MPRRSQSPAEDSPSRSRPASTPDDRETQMIELADALAERQLREGTASSQVLTHYLKLGSSRERKEQAMIQANLELAMAKVEQISNQAQLQDMFAEAIRAMTMYQGGNSPVPIEEEFE